MLDEKDLKICDDSFKRFSKELSKWFKEYLKERKRLAQKI